MLPLAPTLAKQLPRAGPGAQAVGKRQEAQGTFLYTRMCPWELAITEE